MRAKLLLTKVFLILLGCGIAFSHDTLNYYRHHFRGNVLFADSLTKSKCIVQDGSIKNERPERYGLKSIRIDCNLVEFSETTFDSVADFKLIKFKHNVQFYSSLFLGKSSFAYSVFEGPTSFMGSTFKDPNNDFNPSAYELDISGGTSFIETHFKAPVDLNAVYCKNKVFFINTKFDSLASFFLTIFQKKAHFNSAVFSDVVIFQFTQFTEGADFEGATLPDTLYFNKVSEIGNQIDFSSARLNSNKNICYINLTGSNIDKIRINYDQFKLFFLNSDTENEITSVYEKLLKKFHDDGFADSYQKLDIEFQKYKYNKAGQWFRSWLQEWWWNYGYNKEKIFQNSFTLLLIFFIINVLIGVKWGYNFLIKEVYEVENIELEVERLEAKYASQKIKLFFSWLPMVFIYTCMLFFILNLNIKHIRYRHKYALTYLLSVFMIGLVCAAYIINFVLDK